MLDQPATARLPSAKLEPLENGERIHATAFLRRYEAMTDVAKIELVEGVVYMPSPVRIDRHAEPDGLTHVWLGTYALKARGVRFAANPTVIFDAENVPQPDSLLRLLPEHGGNATVNAKGYLVGAPELLVEIAASRTSLELGDKFRAYRRNRVPEYLVWRVAERRFDWFVLEDDEYVALTPDAAGLLRSRAFPGLWLEVAALLAMDGPAVLAALERGLASPEHAAWLARAA